MRSIFTFLCFLITLSMAGSLQAQTSGVPQPPRTLGSIERFKPEFDKLVGADAKIEILADGFTWSEGPLWMGDAKNGYLLFTDIPRNSIFSWSTGHGISLFMQPSGYTGVTYYGLEPGANGLLKDSSGNLVMCEHGDRRVSVLTPNGGKRTLADNYKGKRLNSPNDGVLKSNGDIYFTDPPYGLPMRENDPRRELDHFGVYRISKATGELTLITTELARPNGIGFSPDEKTLYVAQSDPKKAIWMAFPVKDDGTVGPGKLFYDATDQVGKHPGLPDGLSVDTNGNVWASGPGGIYVFNSQGVLLGRIYTGDRTSNCCFGEDGSSLFITANSNLCRIRTNAIGVDFAKQGSGK
ncbi:MAG: SMP-30/gluconolactonase/LRE family protein [Pirellula sp.]|jgi:gluconolactonase